MMKYVLYSVDKNPDYLRFLPVSIASWNRLGWKSAIGYVNADTQKIADKEIGFFSNKLKSSRIAMPFRFCLPNMMNFDDNDIVMTSDADSLVLQANWMLDAMEYVKRGKVVSIAHDWSAYHVVAAWYLMATVKTWHQVIPWTIDEMIEMHYDELSGEDGSSFDERWLYRDIYMENKDKFHFIVRDNDDRINSQELTGICDIHVHLWNYRVFDL